MSHSTRVRGLKFCILLQLCRCPLVALYTSAWIEIDIRCINLNNRLVALYTSAWIEIVMKTRFLFSKKCRTLHECVD